MTSESVAKKLYGDSTNICIFCGEEYVVAESEAWDMAYYCSGECEVLDDCGELDDFDY